MKNIKVKEKNLILGGNGFIDSFNKKIKEYVMNVFLIINKLDEKIKKIKLIT